MPLSTSIPASCDGVPDSLLFKTIKLSSTVNVSVLIVVVVPLTVRLPLNIASLLNVLAPAIVCVPEVLTTVESTAMSFAFAVIPSPPTTSSVAELPSDIAPPPVRPAPAVTVVDEFESLLFAIEPANIAFVIPAALTLNESESISMELSSTPTDKTPLECARPFPATELSSVSVTSPDVPPPVKPSPATTDVISPTCPFIVSVPAESSYDNVIPVPAVSKVLTWSSIFSRAAVPNAAAVKSPELSITSVEPIDRPFLILKF